MKQKLFFKSVDDTMCYPLEGHLLEAKADGLDKVKLIEAVPDNGGNDHIWCKMSAEIITCPICPREALKCRNRSFFSVDVLCLLPRLRSTFMISA